MENQMTFYAPTETERKLFLTRTYLWIGIALLVSAVVSFFAAESGLIISILKATGGMGLLILCIAEIGLVVGLTSSIRKISVANAKLLFILYSALNGLTISTIFFTYTASSIAICFVSAAAMFFGMSLYGLKTKSDLTTAGRYLMMALLGIIIASLLNGILFLFGAGSTMFDWLISVASVVVFTGLTAYDSQKIMRISSSANNSDSFKKIAIYGALELYLDFINIFLSLLRLFGNRK